MARTALTVQNVIRTSNGLTPSYTAANVDGHSIVNDGKKTFLQIKNTGVSACVVTIQTPGTVDGLAVTERTATVGATTGDKMIGPFPQEYYNQADGTIYVDFDQVTSVTCAAIKVP